MMKKTIVASLLGALLLSACSFDNNSGQFAFDLNEVGAQRGGSTAPSQGLAGVYRTEPAKGSSRYEEMRIQRLGERRYQVTISTPGARNGCRFNAVAETSYSQIRIPLSLQNPRLSSVMTITFTGDKASVDTSHPKHFNDLATFCGDGGSLVGGYYKAP